MCRKFLLLLLLLAGLVRAEDVTPQTPYQPLAEMLETVIKWEMEQKGIDGLSIALVDDQQVVWSRGFGYADREEKKFASADTVYRVGSVSKLFTDLVVMQMVQQGKVSLDTPIERYIPKLRVGNSFGTAITIRQLMSHRAGIVREPPLGSYFDASSPSIASTALSLNSTELIYEPGTETKYSNAGITLLGYLVEQMERRSFDDVVRDAILEPYGMNSSGFVMSERLRRERARGKMWTLHGAQFDAPQFEFGIAPAGNLYSSVNDLAKFMSVLMNKGEHRKQRLLREDLLESMWEVQFAAKGQSNGFGLGFDLWDLEGRRVIGHDGAVYGFATSFNFMPDAKIGVIVAVNKDLANSTTIRISSEAMRGMLAIKAGKPLRKAEQMQALTLEQVNEFKGIYSGTDGRWIDLRQTGTNLYAFNQKGGFVSFLGRIGNQLIIEDGPELTLTGGVMKIGDRTLRKSSSPAPAVKTELLEYIGEYGPEHNILYIFEQQGELWALIEWFEFNPLKPAGLDRFKFPETGVMYRGEEILFSRGKDGKVSEAIAGGVVFKRRGASGVSWQSTGEISKILKKSLYADPPKEEGEFRKPELVEVKDLDPTLRLDVRYATTNNFLGTRIYETPRVFLQKPAAEALVRAHRSLKKQGYGLLLLDGYCPWYVTKTFWDATPPRYQEFLADPAKGSRHNRGAAIDVTLFDLVSGRAVEMPSEYDEMTARSYPDYIGGTSAQRRGRDILRKALEQEWFTVYPVEWWHFDFKDWKKYPILNQSF
ncbi:MAG: serine hydrolase [Verrucomicrobiota bacterium]|nr:serine hydrolase [Verrucomicrobiota bacterium]